MAALGNPEGLKEYGQGLEGSLEFAEEHPGEAAAGLLGLDQVQQDLKSGHPGEALGFGIPMLGSLLDPEGGEGAEAARALAKADSLQAGSPHVESTLERIDSTGAAPPGFVGGRTFAN